MSKLDINEEAIKEKFSKYFTEVKDRLNLFPNLEIDSMSSDIAGLNIYNHLNGNTHIKETLLTKECINNLISNISQLVYYMVAAEQKVIQEKVSKNLYSYVDIIIGNFLNALYINIYFKKSKKSGTKEIYSHTTIFDDQIAEMLRESDFKNVLMQVKFQDSNIIVYDSDSLLYTDVFLGKHNEPLYKYKNLVEEKVPTLIRDYLNK